MKNTIIIIFVFTVHSVFSQSKTDTLYIESYPQKIRIKTFVSTNSIEIEDYSPNYPLNLGFGFAIKNTVLNMRFGYGLIPLKGDEFGKTKVLDFQIHNYGRYFVLDLFVQRYKGFFQDNKKGEVTALFPDLSIVQIGAEGTYIFNGNKFSAKAAFDQSEIQLQSAGSFVSGISAYYYEINNIPTSENTNSAENLQMGFNGGYAYSWVINNRWLLSGMATLGANIGNEIETLKDGKLKIYPAAFARMAGTYHKDDWLVGMAMLIQNKVIFTAQGENFKLANINMQLSFTKHFK